MITWADGFISANGTQIHYYRTGGPKPAMLLLHGITDDGLCWTRLARELQDQYDIVMTDARGHGKSDRLSGGLTIEMLVDDAVEVIQKLGLGRPVVFGHSMGAITAAALAAHRPDLVKAVLLEDPPLEDTAAQPLPPEFIEQFRQGLLALRSMTSQERFAQSMKQNPTWDSVENEPWGESKAQVDLNVMGAFDSFREASWREIFRRIQCPGLLITGDPAKGAIVNPQVAQEAIDLWTGGQIVQVAGAGHCIHRDRYPQTLQAVSAFLSRVAQEGH